MNPLLKAICLLGITYSLWGAILSLIDLNPPNFVVAIALLLWCVLFSWSAHRFFQACLS